MSTKQASGGGNLAPGESDELKTLIDSIPGLEQVWRDAKEETQTARNREVDAQNRLENARKRIDMLVDKLQGKRRADGSVVNHS